MTIKELKEELRSGKWAWPGGYPKYFITSDGTALSFEAVRDEFYHVVRSIKQRSNDGWRVEAVDINWEDPTLYCDHSNERIESAYCESESGLAFLSRLKRYQNRNGN